MTSLKTLLSLSLCLLISHLNYGQFKSESVLSQNSFYKFSIKNTGIYKIDFNQLSSIPELNIQNADPRNIKIYANNGGIVPQENNAQRIDDLAEIAIFVSGQEDGSFDNNDYILVYMEGADRFKYEGANIIFEKNPYDLNNYFFLTVDNSPGLRVSMSEQVSVGDYDKTTETVIRHENDLINLLGNFGSTEGTGKRWYGENFSNDRVQSFNSSFNFPDLIPGAIANYEIVMASRSSRTASFELNFNGNIFSRNVSATNTGDVESVYARRGFIRESSPLSKSNPDVIVTYNPPEASSQAWLDYIQVSTEEYINYDDTPRIVFRRDSRLQANYGYDINTNKNVRVWNITDIENINSLPLEINGSSRKFAFITNSIVQSFMVFADSDVRNKPTFVSKVAKQNLHALDRADLIIVYHKNFLEAANRLAEHRRNHDFLEVELVDIDHVYNEFGGGKKDPSALRDLARMMYNRDPNFRYLLLFGDGSYDYRGLVSSLEYQNFVPTYETNESLHPIKGFPTDDFFALLSPNEGDDLLDGALDIGVGRIPCKTLQEANWVVDKIMNYDLSANALGEWRTRLGFAADDEDFNGHMIQADGIANLTLGNHPDLIQQKVYFDAYNQESTPGGARYPDANRTLVENLANGQLVLNYLGHGGPKGWAQERVFQIEDINSLSNYDKLPLLITATCSFTGFDDPAIVSAGEQALLNPSGGAIALFSTVRAVFSSQNERITREVFKKIFQRPSGERKRFGDIIRESQNANSSDTTSDNTRKFMLFGDPSQTLALPIHKVVIDAFNEMEVVDGEVDTITLGALNNSVVRGHIENYNGDQLNDFNGDVFITVFDKSSRLKALDNDNSGSAFEFNSRKNILYKGSATVENGQFEIEFVIPIDINFDEGLGFLSLYATDNDSQDANGFFDQFIIGGTNSENIADNEGPQIDIFLNNRNFVSGDLVGSNALLIVDLEDETGINLSGTSIGHDITAILDNDTGAPITLNGFYTPTSDKTGAGTISYLLEDLEPGMHQIKIKAWDVLNNSSESEVRFMVGDAEDGFVKSVKNYPNPVGNYTYFSFESDFINTNLDVEIDIYTLNGQKIRTLNKSVFANGSLVDKVEWNRNDGTLNILENGLYLYKIKVTSIELNQSRESNFHKLVIFN